jgi:hypothetical protein
MITKTLYRFKREDGGITYSLTIPNAPFTQKIRLVAETGKALTKDRKNFYSCIDVDNIDGWFEVDAPPEMRDV